EIPKPFAELNSFGVPWVSLLTATILPVIVLNVDDSVTGLASLYAIGVVGAIAINVGSCAFARDLPMPRYERVTMSVTFVILCAIWITIAWTKFPALMFVTVVLAVGLGIREWTRRRIKKVAAAPLVAGAPVPPVPAPVPTPPEPAPALEREPFLGESIL